jgi:dihydroxyacetone kinase-like protein
MKKFINDSDAYVSDMLSGIFEAHSDSLAYADNDMHCVMRKENTKEKVSIISGGGSGHLPTFMGYVGKGLLDGCAVGDVFQSPSSAQVYALTTALDHGKGILYLYGNYSGDIMTFDMAAEMAEIDDIEIESILANDDIASAPRTEREKRRGVAGIFYVYKIAGAAAEAGMDLQEVARLARKANDNVGTMGVALSPCIIPAVGKPTFSIAENTMEVGMGIHGEPGIDKTTLKSADEIVDYMLPKILEDISVVSGDRISVLVNGLGGTSLEELYILYRRISEVLKKDDITVVKMYCGEYATSMEMTGFSLSVFKLDDELETLLKTEASTPFFEQRSLC